MLTIRSCPDTDQLRCFPTGTLSSSAREVLQEHLTPCSTCQRTVADLQAAGAHATEAGEEALPTRLTAQRKQRHWGR
jgi:hypothetical protein